MTLNEVAMALLGKPHSVMLYYFGDGRILLEVQKSPEGHRKLFNQFVSDGILVDAKAIAISVMSGCKTVVCRIPAFLIDDLGEVLIGPTIGKVVNGIGLFFDFSRRSAIEEISLQEIKHYTIPSNKQPLFENAFRRLRTRTTVKVPVPESGFDDSLEVNVPKIPITVRRK
jgi:hypothetical protein